MAKKVKMADIATALNVSTVTVSKALSGQKGVSEEMRQRIRELASELGYQHSQASIKAERMPSYNIGVIVPTEYFGKFESFYWQMYQEVATESLKKGCFTLLEVISPEDEADLTLPMLVKEQKADGIILIGRPDSSYIKKIRDESKMPLVCLDFFDESGNCDSVISDGFYGTYILTNHLFDKGHNEIAYVGTLLYTGSITDRYLGYLKSMMEHGVEVKKEWVLDDRDWERGDVTGFEFKLPQKMPHAFVCNSDLTASALIKAVREQGYRVPEDISVVGFDNFLFPGLCDIGITTYEVDTKEMARKSISILLKKINRQNYKTGIHIVEGSLIQKDSVLMRIR